MAAPLVVGTNGQTATGVNPSPATGVNLANPPIPQWLVPIVGLIILAALATTSLFKPISIVLVGIIALWLMNG